MNYQYFDKLLRFFFLLSLLGLVNTCALAQNEPFTKIKNRISADLQFGVNDEALTAKIKTVLPNLNDDGSWKDIDYVDAQYEPLTRIKEMAIAFIRPTNKFFNDKILYQSIIKSLQNWADKNPRNKNWWYNDIFYPQAIGQTLILMQYAKTPLPTALENELIQRMKRKLKTGDGANTSDEALHYLYRACVTQNKTTLDSAAKYLFEPISILDGKEGIQVDGSYYQHGKQQAIASYGRVFVGNSVNAAFYLNETPYALPQAQLKILVDYLKNTFLKTIRGSFYDFNVRGRGISRKDSLQGLVSHLVSKIKMFDAENSAYWEASEKRTAHIKSANYGIEASHKQYWKSGYTLHVNPKYTFSVQAASSRTLRTERGNNENILGQFLADGATNIQRDGSEYANLMPVWEWDKIPGTTSRDYASDSAATIKQDWGILGTTSFVGGVSDGLYGASVYTLDYDSVQAKKAWFFFGEEIVCLGAGISSTTNENIVTTLNQAWLRNDIVVSLAGKVSTLKKNSTTQLPKAKWLLQDSIAYFFPQGGNITVSDQEQTGDWYRINRFQSKNEVSHPVFKLWFNHGLKPQNEHYAYIVVPGVRNALELEKYDQSMIQILQNTATIQAVKHKEMDMLQVVFYKAGVLKSKGIFIKVDRPCVIYIKELSTKTPTLYMADPAQQYSSVHVEINLPNLAKEQNINLLLPVGAFAGSTIQFKLKE